ncbi:MAG: hypothetical protein RSB72_02880, partial [Bacilli bacterium]
IKNNFICEINFDFNNKKLVDNILKDTHLIKKSFTNTIVYQFIIDNYLLDNVLLKLKLNNIKIKSITKI